jgi:putative ABC transport system permease protein
MFYSTYEIIRLALRCLSANLLRSLLTLLGIIIGVGSVIFMMSVTAGAGRQILQEMRQLGLRNIIINSSQTAGGPAGLGPTGAIQKYGLLRQDLRQIGLTCQNNIDFITEAHEVREEVWLGGKPVDCRVLGVESRYFDVLKLKTIRGRTLCDLDNDEAQPKFVCCVGSHLLDQLGVVKDRLTVAFQILDLHFDVVGVLQEPRFTSRARKALATQKQFTLYIPAQTARRHFGTTFMSKAPGSDTGITVEVDQAIVGVRPDSSVIATADAIRQIMERNHPQRDYQIVVPLELLQQEKKTQQVMNVTMILIASISLVVGGIGIINIMLATVTERTREIGIRRACGARRRHIAVQFLIETTTLSLLGGIIGALVGVGGVHVIAPKIGWPAIVTTESLILALGISCAVGILFGTYPAMKAAQLDPIEALRFE